MFTKSLITLGLVTAMSLSMSGAFAQNFDSRDGYRNEQHADYRDMRRDGRDFRNDRYDRRGDYREMRSDRRDFRHGRDDGGRGNFERGGHGYAQNGRGNFGGGGHGSWQGSQQNHFASNGHSFGSGSRGRR